MKAVHLALMVFCHVLLASVVFHFTSLVTASPLFEAHKDIAAAAAAAPVPVRQIKETPIVQHQPIVPTKDVAAPAVVVASPVAQVAPKVEPALSARSAIPHPDAHVAHKQQQQPQIIASAAAIAQASPISQPIEQAKIIAQPVAASPSKVVVEPEPVLTERKAIEPKVAVAPVAAKPAVEAINKDVKQQEVAPKIDAPAVVEAPKKAVEHVVAKAPTSPLANQQVELIAQPQSGVVVKDEKLAPAVPQPAALVAAEPPHVPAVAPAAPVVPVEPAVHAVVPHAPVQVPIQVPVQAPAPAPVQVVEQPVVSSGVVAHQKAPVVAVEQAFESPRPIAPAPVVMGGLGPLHLLASTLCSYQVDKLVADEHLNQLYSRRASVRKSLFEFMSLKFTNLEKLSSRLGYGLQVVPVKSPEDNKAPGLLPSHGWPVVGKCTAHDLKLMGEAAWCECNPKEEDCGSLKVSEGQAVDKSASVAISGAPAPVDEAAAKITSNRHLSTLSNARAVSSRSIDSTNSFLPAPEESSVISKILLVSDIKNAPTVESSIYNLNLTQHQLATLEAQATSTQECRRNALRYTKALFNHLAEDQKSVSETWPRLYALISSDDCARKRMIDIVNALSSFRTDTTSIRRDNLEFAFAMDDLRAKVLESEVNVPLTFDRHFIEVEQFLQQSVRLMLANVQPKRAKLTSMRYRSLMYGTSQSAVDDQCIDLHQRLLSRNYPNDCNPTQFGQLPDVLRMTASSLELWSIEKELSLQTARQSSAVGGQQKVKDDVNECIANLVSS